MLRTTAVWTGLAGAPYFSTLYWAGSTAAAADDAVLRHQDYLTAVSGHSSASMTGQVNREVSSVNTANGDVLMTFNTAAQAPVTGISGATQLPHANQMLVQLRTGQYIGGRQVRGKLFLPGQTIADMVPGLGTVSPATASGFATQLKGIFDTGPLLVWSRKAGVAFTVTDVTIALQYAVLRSRRD